MIIDLWNDTTRRHPVCTGTGLVALDLVINENLLENSTPNFWVGGSCGNVLTILAYLGWKSYPITRLSKNSATKKILNDLENWDVDTSLILQEEGGNTPVIVQKIYTNKYGVPKHKFEWNCPSCGALLPKYKPLTLKSLSNLSSLLPEAQVFFFDRVTPSSIALAKKYKDQGTLIYFEPSAIKDLNLFIECLKITDILKYSIDRLPNIQDITSKMSIPLEIETLGSEGLVFRKNSTLTGLGEWKKLPAIPVSSFKDASGSGDWCTAGLISSLCNTGSLNINARSQLEVENAIIFGQILAALNCQFDGARGIMYAIKRYEFIRLIEDMLNVNFVVDNSKYLDYSYSDTDLEYCVICNNK